MHFLICTVVNYLKFAWAKLVFHGHYFAIFRAFTRALFFARAKIENFARVHFGFARPKKKHWLETIFEKSHRSSVILKIL